MRKFFYGLGAAIGIIILAAGIGIFFLARNGAALDAESKAYVKDAVVAITADWNADELMKRSTPDFRRVTKPDLLQSLFDAARTALGPLVEYEGAKGDSTAAVMAGSGTTISARYMAHAKFQKGEAYIQITLLKIDGTWRIEGFNIRSDAVLRTLTGRPA
jgi:hypothetical protein